MQKILLTLTLWFSLFSLAQIKGTVKDENGKPLPYVNIFIENTYIGTTSNELGNYELNLNEKKDIHLIFQHLGFKTQKHFIASVKMPYQLDITLIEENYELKELVINTGENPTNEIIKKAIAARKKNAAKTDKFEADFYSRGIIRVQNVPQKIIGININNLNNDLNGNLDANRNGILYQSETVSKIKFEKPDHLKEEIIASKIAGNDNGFSYNTALNTNYDFYENYVNFGINMVSPIADNAFNYYKFKLESTFLDDNQHLINKIKVTPKRDKEPVFDGYIYIVEDSWAIYGIDLDIKGYRIQTPILETMKLTQNFSYNNTTKIWAKNIQSLDFSAGIFGMKITGRFTHVFSNYQFIDSFDKKTFGKEIVSFATNANKKEATYWDSSRPVPLTEEELKNYSKKDSIQIIRKSVTYLDSIDAKGNRFKFQDIFTGYTYKNSKKKWRFSYQGIVTIESLKFNTVQGYNFDSGFSYQKRNDENGKFTTISSTFNYGFAEDRLRVKGNYYHRFNNQNNAYISASGGSSVSQFNSNEPISAIVNSVSTLFFKNNFMKLYNKEFVDINYGREVANGLFISGKLLYENRRALLNNTDHTVVKNNDIYSSNDPLQPSNFTSTPFNPHHVFKFQLGTRIHFGEKYISRPDGKITIQNEDYPVLSVNYEKVFGATHKYHQYDLISGVIDFSKTLGNKGDFGLRIKAGKFFGAQNIAFVDFKHFNGNLTHVNIMNNSLNSFNLLPYYSHSTNDAYLETHIEHNFKGYIMNKIPLLNKLQWNLIGGFHQINIPKFKPYQEVTVGFDNIGWGKFRFLRIDYVRSYQNGYQGDGVMFGLKF